MEFAHSTEGSRYVQDVITLPNGSVQPYSFESFHRLQQASARLVWQFGDNAWVHPYLGAGVAIDIDRRRVFGPPQFGDGPGNTLVPPVRGNGFSGKTLDTRVGVSLSGGAKAYVSRNAFFSGGAAGTVHKHGGTFSLVGGFGFDF